ncbi:uncharacterized protein LOC132257782 [Phlebotomus argentipes]|uniref:uncharacterized protein LOC132257782 n=1 Tax=Phlebotomus argentipes TaxID=94469 RepID=UPI00289298E2|nr:uncharacterized protein LOC132257782 [Phlebotomus argentipes]XP_059610797.1 uncharacterized protein LOC132257782 [Phlebotomus argentipes]
MFLEEGEKMLESCVLPKCVTDITDCPIEANHFQEYKKHLEYLLPTLFDLISSREIELFDCVPETLRFRKLFVEFVCEQTSDCATFQTEVALLRRNLLNFERRLKKMLKDDGNLGREMIVLYKSKLLGEAWKRNLGAIYGFIHFCKVSFRDNQDNPLDLDKAMFILSIGSQFLENHDPAFKLCGLKLFRLILESLQKDKLMETNTHEVIYSQAIANVDKLNSEECTQEIWKCVWLSMSIDKKVPRNLQWNKFDDCLQTLIYKLKLESNLGTRRFLQDTLIRFVLFTIPDKEKIEVNWNAWASNNQESLNALKRKRGTFDNAKCYRWAKSLLDMIVFQFLTIASSRQDAIPTIQFVHTTYLITLSFIKRDLLDEFLTQFVKRSLPICAEILNIFRDADSRVQEELIDFLTTVNYQTSERQDENNYFKALSDFLAHVTKP